MSGSSDGLFETMSQADGSERRGSEASDAAPRDRREAAHAGRSAVAMSETSIFHSKILRVEFPVELPVCCGTFLV